MGLRLYTKDEGNKQNKRRKEITHGSSISRSPKTVSCLKSHISFIALEIVPFIPLVARRQTCIFLPSRERAAVAYEPWHFKRLLEFWCARWNKA